MAYNVGDVNYAVSNSTLDGNTDIIGMWIDNVLLFIGEIFKGLGDFGTTMGILIGVGFVVVLILAATGKIKISSLTGGIMKR